MSEKLYNTTGNEEESLDYRTKGYKQEAQGNPPNPYLFQTSIINPKWGPVFVPGRKALSISGDKWSKWGEGFSGDTEEEYQDYLVQNQPGFVKFVNSYFGGMISGLGTAIEDLGYMTDLNTYAGIFGNIDFDPAKEMGLVETISGAIPRFLQSTGQGIKKATEEYMPIYEQQGGTIGEQVFSWSALKGVMDSAVGFTLAGFGAGAAVKGITKLGLSAITKLGKSLEISNRVKALPSVVSKLNKIPSALAKTETYANYLYENKPLAQKLANTFGTFASSVLTKGAEARMEGLGAFEEGMNLQREAISSGMLSYNEAKENANKAANHAFDMTMLTTATDMLMLKDLFKGPLEVTDKLIKPGFKTALLKAGKLALGAPKEGLEEMWQEAAQMEGGYNIYQAIKSRLTDDQKYNYINRLGFDPDKTAENYWERTTALLDSKRAKVAGWIGALSGPLQSAAMDIIGSRGDEYKKAYEKQQALFSGNKTLFDATNKFADKIKDVKLQKDLRMNAALAGDDILMDLTTQTAFENIALDNFINGTHSQLEEVLNQNPSAESDRLKPILGEMKKDYIKAKQYVNTNQIFSLVRGIKMREKILQRFVEKSNNKDLPETERNSYAKLAVKAQQEIDTLKQEYKDQTSTSNQLKLMEEAKVGQDKLNIYENLANISSITQLEKLLEKYPDDEVFTTTIKQQINAIQKDSISPKKTKVNNKVTKVEDEDGPAIIKGETYNYKGLDYLVNDVVTDQDGTVTSVKVTNLKTSKDEVVGNKSKNPDFIDRWVSTKQETNEQGVVKQPKEQQKINVKETLRTTFEELNKLNGTNIQPDYEKDVNSMTGVYESTFNTAQSESEVTEALSKKARELYTHKMNSTKEDDNITYVENEESSLSDEQVQAVNDLMQAFVVEQVPPGASQEMNMDSINLAQIRVNRMLNLFKVWSTTGKRIDKDFKVLVQELSKVKGVTEVIKENYKEFKNTYLYVQSVMGIESDTIIPDSFEELFGEDLFEPISPVNSDMFTIEDLKRVGAELDKVQRVSPDEAALIGLYTNDAVNKDSKNTLPASSMAHRSQEWDWTIDKWTKEEKVVGRTTRKGATVEANPLLNSNKYNAGDIVKLSLDTEYKGDITLSTGVEIPYTKFKEYQDLNMWDEAKRKLELGPNEEFTDYIPIKIEGNTDGTIAYVHNVAWINKLNAVDSVIENNQTVLRNFRRELVKKLNNNNNTPINTTVTEKAIDITKEGKLKGAVLNTAKERGLTSDRLPDTNLKFGINTAQGLSAPLSNIKAGNILNYKFLNSFNDKAVFVFTPLGKKNGEMVYWAHPILPNTLTPGMAKSIRQAVEIYLTRNENLYPNFYNSYAEKGIDLKDTKDLNKFLQTVVYLFKPKSEKGNVVEEMDEYIKSKVNQTSLIAFQGDTITFGRSSITSFKRGTTIDSKKLDFIEKNILGNMLFNINKTELNNPNLFTFVEAGENDTIDEIQTSYNEFVKQNTSTMANSTLLRDGSYGYTIQHIVRFDLNPVELQKEIEESATKKVSKTMSKHIETKKTLTPLERYNTLLNNLKNRTGTLYIVTDSTETISNQIVFNFENGQIRSGEERHTFEGEYGTRKNSRDIKTPKETLLNILDKDYIYNNDKSIFQEFKDGWVNIPLKSLIIPSESIEAKTVEEETITMTDLSQDKDIQNLLSQINVEREESKKITSDKILIWANQGKTKEQIIATLNMALKAKLNTDQKNCD